GMRDDASSGARPHPYPSPLGRGGGGVRGAPRSASLLRARGRRAQDGVILAEDPVRLGGAVLMALVAGGDSALGHLLLERVLVAEAEVGVVVGIVLEALRVLDRGFQAREPPLEVALAAGRLL